MPEPWFLSGACPYRQFTNACNAGRVRVLLSSGQACVWYRLSLASKDGDWLVREDEDTCAAVRAELARLGARYRLGAPLDVRWLSAGWSAHFEALDPTGLRLRFDFVSRPPRVDAARLARCWAQAESGPAVVDIPTLILLKQTMRLKDYPFIGGLAARLADPADQMRWTIDPDHFTGLLSAHPTLVARVGELRPALAGAIREVDSLGAAIDHEIRTLRRSDEHRIAAYTRAMDPWALHFRTLGTDDLSLPQAHARLCAAADGILPTVPPKAAP